jgi:diguanylate cyclase
VSWIGNGIVMSVVFAYVTNVVATALRTARRNEAGRAAELARAEQEARRLALTDGLTGLFNRSHGDATLDQFVAAAARGRGFSVLALDIDNMKRINDTGGHASGDAAIVGVAELLRTGLRGMDVAIRTGGDEFVVLLPTANATQAAFVRDRLSQSLEARNQRAPGRAFHISIGVAEWRPGMSSADILAAADAALYLVKAGLARERTTPSRS